MRRTRPTFAAAATALAVLLVGLGVAAPAAADDPAWPTQAEVDQAKQNAAASAAEYAKIQQLVRQQQSAAVAAAAAALERQNDYAKAQQQYQLAAAKAARLQSQAEAAQADSAAADRRLGQIASQLYLAGGSSGLTGQLLLSHGKASALLDRLSAINRLTGIAAGLRDTASAKANLAASLSGQASQAQDARGKLQTQAEQAASAAKEAQSRADAALASAQRQSQTAYAQMAELQDQSAQLQEKWAEYQAYLAALARQRAQQGDASYLYQISRSITPDPTAAQAYARSQLPAYGWGADQFPCLQRLWTIESGWRVNAYNPSSEAYGIPQAWPGQKMATYGDDWTTSYTTQITWGLHYIKQSYGNPCGALAFETSHVPYWY